MKRIESATSHEGVPADKSRARALVRTGVRSQRTPPVAARTKGLRDGTMCERCGDVYRDKRWHAGSAGERAWPVGFTWTVCPACRQTATGESFGRILLRGAAAVRESEALQRRIRSIADRARFTQPQRRIVSIERRDGEIEVRTTSQRLAHRIAAGLLHAFGGESRFAWSSPDGTLDATWTWDSPAPPAKERRATRAERVRERAVALGKPALEVEIQGRNVDVDPAWRDRIERRITRWNARFPDLARVVVTLVHGPHHRNGSEEASVSLAVRGKTLHGRKRGATMALAVRDVLKALDGELRDVREERRESHRNPKPNAAVPTRRARAGRVHTGKAPTERTHT